MHIADRLIRTIQPVLTDRNPPPMVRALQQIRRQAVDETLAASQTIGATASADITAGVEGARGNLAAAAEDALADYHRRVLAAPHPAHRIATRIDSGWHDPDLPELLDDPSLDEGLRRRIMHRLDHINHVLGNYDRFLDALVPYLRTDGPTTILDLAAGHGGFAIAATEAAKARGFDLRFVATDLKQEYLDLGAEEARKRGVDVKFAVQDALNLENLADERFDIVVCTQSLHHFPAGLVTVMFDAAARVAGRAVVFIDGCRSALTGFGLGVWGLAHERRWAAFSHDAFASARRFYVPEELELLCRMTPLGNGVQVRWIRPGHICAAIEIDSP